LALPGGKSKERGKIVIDGGGISSQKKFAEDLGVGEKKNMLGKKEGGNQPEDGTENEGAFVKCERNDPLKLGRKVCGRPRKTLSRAEEEKVSEPLWSQGTSQKKRRGRFKKGIRASDSLRKKGLRRDRLCAALREGKKVKREEKPQCP